MSILKKHKKQAQEKQQINLKLIGEKYSHVT